MFFEEITPRKAIILCGVRITPKLFSEVLPSDQENGNQRKDG
jgi:hypothetical protein